MALRLALPNDTRLKTKFVAECDEWKLTWLKAMASHLGDDTPDYIYKDIRERDNATAPEVDLFVSGAPCPPFSSAGLRKSLQDKRGWLILWSLRYVIMKRPPIAVLENVRGLVDKKNKWILKRIKKILEKIGYRVKCDILNTKDHGIPQNRPRVYLVAVMKACEVSGRVFEFPTPIPCAKLGQFLSRSGEPCKLSPAASKNVEKCLKRLKEDGLNVSSLPEEVIVDAAAGKNFFSYMIGNCPCITKARGGANGFYLIGKKRYLSLEEVGALQGWTPKHIEVMLENGKDSRSRLGQAFGDAMSINVLARVLPRALWSVGLVAEASSESWEWVDKAPAGKMPASVYS